MICDATVTYPERPEIDQMSGAKIEAQIGALQQICTYDCLRKARVKESALELFAQP